MHLLYLASWDGGVWLKKKNSGGDFQLAQRKRGKSLGVGVASSPVLRSTLPNKKFLISFSFNVPKPL